MFSIDNFLSLSKCSDKILIDSTGINDFGKRPDCILCP